MTQKRRTGTAGSDRCPNCGAVIARCISARLVLLLWTFAGLLFAGGVFGYVHSDPGPRPREPFSKPLTLRPLLFEEPLPDDWQRFLPPGVEQLPKERGLQIIRAAALHGAPPLGASPYEEAIWAAKEEARRYAHEQRKQRLRDEETQRKEQLARAQEEWRRAGRLQAAFGWATFLSVATLVVAGLAAIRATSIRPAFCWQCGGQLRRGREHVAGRRASGTG